MKSEENSFIWLAFTLFEIEASAVRETEFSKGLFEELNCACFL